MEGIMYTGGASARFQLLALRVHAQKNNDDQYLVQITASVHDRVNFNEDVFK